MLRDTEVVKVNIYDDLEIIIIGTIGDGSCFFHSVLKAINFNYQNNISNRSILARKFRKSIADLLVKPSLIYEEKELYELIKKNNIEIVFNKYVLNPEPKFKNVGKDLIKLVLEDPKRMINRIIYDETLINESNYEEILEKIKYGEYMEKYGELRSGIKDKYYNLIIENLDLDVDDFEDNVLKTKKKKNVVQLFRLIKSKFSYDLYDKEEEYYSKYSLTQIPTVDKFKEKIMKSIYVKTGKIFREEDYNEIMEIDPREDFEIQREDILWKLPLNLNYFCLKNFQMLSQLKTLKKLHINKLYKILNSNSWASYDNIITFMPSILKINIHIVTYEDDEFELYEKSNFEYNLNIIIRYIDELHFELVGCLDENSNIQTLFENNHLIIEKLYKK